MISFLNSWVGGIALSIIIASIIEMILPESKNKKYIKTVIGVYIIYVIVSPIISKVAGKEIEVNAKVYEEYLQTSNTIYQNTIENQNTKTIEDIYTENLKQDIKQKLKQKGYVVNNIAVEIETKNQKEYGLVKKIELSVSLGSTDDSIDTASQITINEIPAINITQNNTSDTSQNIAAAKLSERQKNEIKEYLNLTYEINKNNITINT